MNDDLREAETGISSCPSFENCNGSSSCRLELSSISPGDNRRGHRNAKILLITEAPDRDSAKEGAYQGSITNRIISMFCDEEYGIGLNDDSNSFVDFLEQNKIYSTSAIKCFIGGNINEISNYVINQCRKRYLTKQIQAMDDPCLIIPLGKLAAVSILKKNLSNTKITNLVGYDAGITCFDESSSKVVVLPHPSGSNPRSNPPILTGDENRVQKVNKIKFRDALQCIRKELADLDYDVLDGNPDCWDSLGGLSEFR